MAQEKREQAKGYGICLQGNGKGARVEMMDDADVCDKCGIRGDSMSHIWIVDIDKRVDLCGDCFIQRNEDGKKMQEEEFKKIWG